MKKKILTIATVFLAVIVSACTIAAQDAMKMKSDAMNMVEMKNSPHHKLMMAYMRSMSDFARMIRDQALTPNGPDVEFARTAVAELRHDLDAVESMHQKHVAAMSPEMKTKMQMMMDSMAKGQATVKEHVIALEKAVQVDKPDAKLVAMHANELVKHLATMKMAPGRKTAAKKKMKMTM